MTLEHNREEARMKGKVERRGTTYTYVVDLPRKIDGKRNQRKKGGFRTKREAEEALAILLADIARGVVADPGRTTLGAYMEEWLESIATTVRPTTLDNYTRALHLWIKPHLGGVKLRDLTPGMIQHFYNELSATGRQDGTGGLSPASVRIAHKVLALGLRRAVQWRLLAVNPASADSGLALPTASRVERQTWSLAESKQFVEHCRKKREPLTALWLLYLSTGMRRGEALGLTWKNVNMETGVVTIEQAYVLASGCPVMSSTKTTCSRRMVHLRPEVIKALDKYRARQMAVTEHKAGFRMMGYVFTTRVGTLLYPGEALKLFQAVCKRAGVPVITIHGLRHTFATLALEAGVDMKIVQETLGHSNLAMTADIYTRVTGANARNATNMIGDLLFPPESLT